MAKQERKLWAGLAVFTAAVAAGLGYLYVNMQHPVLALHQHDAVAHSLLVAPISSSQGHEEDSFSDAMARLNTAFQVRSKGDAEKVIAMVNTRSATGARPCPFEWRNGEAALALQTDSHGKLPLTQTINACADSIERLP